MKTNRLLAAALIMGAVSFSSCSKSSDPTPAPIPTPPPPTNTEKLCGKNFKVTAYTADPGVPGPGGVKTTDLMTMLPACYKDNLTNFSSDGTYKYDEGPTKCNASDPQTSPGTWSWMNGEVNIKLDKTVFKLLQNDGNVFKVSTEDTVSTPGTKQTFTMTMTKQ